MSWNGKNETSRKSLVSWKLSIIQRLVDWERRKLDTYSCKYINFGHSITQAFFKNMENSHFALHERARRRCRAASNVRGQPEGRRSYGVSCLDRTTRRDAGTTTGERHRSWVLAESVEAARGFEAFRRLASPCQKQSAGLETLVVGAKRGRDRPVGGRGGIQRVPVPRQVVRGAGRPSSRDRWCRHVCQCSGRRRANSRPERRFAVRVRFTSKDWKSFACVVQMDDLLVLSVWTEDSMARTSSKKWGGGQQLSDLLQDCLQRFYFPSLPKMGDDGQVAPW